MTQRGFHHRNAVVNTQTGAHAHALSTKDTDSAQSGNQKLLSVTHQHLCLQTDPGAFSFTVCWQLI